MRALVTGGAGFIGGHLTASLVDAGHEVVVLDNLSTGVMSNLAHVEGQAGFRFVEGSVLDVPLVNQLVASSDLVFHFAAAVGMELVVSDPLGTLQTNLRGTETVLDAAADRGVQVLLASTSEVYGKREEMPLREDDDIVMGATTRGRWAYAASKMLDEFLALAYHRQRDVPLVIFRLFNVIGTRQTGRYGMVLPRFVRQAIAGEPLTVYGDGQQTRSLLDVEDTVRALIGLAHCNEAKGKVVNIGSTEERTILSIANAVIERVGKGPGHDVVFIPYKDVFGPDFEDVMRRVPDVQRVRSLLGWEPRIPLEQTIDRIANTMTEKGINEAQGLRRQGT